MILRPAVLADAAFLYLLRTDPTAAAMSIGPPPSFDGHMDWVRRTLADPTRRLFIAERHGALLGTARLDNIGGSVAEVSITVAPQERGKRVGRGILLLLDDAAIDWGIRRLAATIKPENVASKHLFAGAGYTEYSQLGATLWQKQLLV